MTKSYEPRPGSKVAIAFDALLDGPMTPNALAKVMDVPAKALTAMLTHPIERGSLVKLQNAAGALHYARADVPAGERFAPAGKAEPGEARPYNPSDPFGLVAKAAATRSQPLLPPVDMARCPPMPKIKPPRSEEAAEQVEQPEREATAAAQTITPAIPTAPDSDEFVAGLFSNGELMIRAGAQEITLTEQHTRQLFAYLDRIQETAA